MQRPPLLPKTGSERRLASLDLGSAIRHCLHRSIFSGVRIDPHLQLLANGSLLEVFQPDVYDRLHLREHYGHQFAGWDLVYYQRLVLDYPTLYDDEAPTITANTTTCTVHYLFARSARCGCKQCQDLLVVPSGTLERRLDVYFLCLCLGATGVESGHDVYSTPLTPGGVPRVSQRAAFEAEALCQHDEPKPPSVGRRRDDYCAYRRNTRPGTVPPGA